MGLWEESTAEEKSQKCEIWTRNSEKMPELQKKIQLPFLFFLSVGNGLPYKSLYKTVNVKH